MNWGEVLAGSAARRVELPPYAFQRQRYWIESGAAAGDAAAAGQERVEHPLLSAAVALAEGEGGRLFTGRVSLSSHPWLADHMVLGSALLPGTALLELALHAGGRSAARRWRSWCWRRRWRWTHRRTRRCSCSSRSGEPQESGTRPIAIHARPEGGAWTRHARGLLASSDDNARAGVNAAGGSWQRRVPCRAWPADHVEPWPPRARGGRARRHVRADWRPSASTTGRRSRVCGACGATARSCSRRWRWRRRSSTKRASSRFTLRCSTRRCTRSRRPQKAIVRACPSPGAV